MSGEMVIYLSKNVLTFFAIGGEGKGTHSPESKYVAIRITASANSLLQMELPAFLWFMPPNFQDLRILKSLGFEDHYIPRMLGSWNPKDFRILNYKSSSFIAHDFQDLRILKSLKFQNPQLQIIIITRTYTKILRI